jgi:DNA-binding NtrC family response regulator
MAKAEHNSGGTDVARDLRARYRLDPAGARAQILGALEACHGDATRAARLLGVGRRTLNRYLETDKALVGAGAQIRDKRSKESAAQ